MSRFVAAGSEGEPTEQDEKWLAAQKAIDATRSKPKVELGSQEGGKSLYETLQANKAAKQEAFEQSIRLGNQFQSLDEDDVEFLDSVLESTRAQEAAVKRETKEQLDAFRQQQLEAERQLAKSGGSASPVNATETPEQIAWTVSRKRKKDHKDVLRGVKLRKSLSSGEQKPVAEVEESEKAPTSSIAGQSSAQETHSVHGQFAKERAEKEPVATGDALPAPVGLGLGAYSSDEDD